MLIIVGVRLSVVITAYQSEDFLDECLGSVCSSYYMDLQIVLVNDGSTDATALEVTVQNAPIPQSVLDYAANLTPNSVKIRDVAGRVYN